MKTKTIIIITTLTLCIMLSAANGFADVPAPPVDQTLGFADVDIGSQDAAGCRVCHDSGIPDDHHLLYGTEIPDPSVVPFPDSDDNGTDDTTYNCLNCHDNEFNIERDCTVCHTTSPHHATVALNGECVTCHGDFVDDMDDGHYIPTYAPSLVTPLRKDGEGEPDNSREKGAGACDYCHDNDGLTEPIILTNMELHHETGFIDDSNTCAWCHDFGVPREEQTRVCEGCHGPDSLHNIQADSPNPNNIGTLVVGGEDAGYGHVGRDAGPGDSDCWGCHGFATGSASAPGTGPITPSLSESTRDVIIEGNSTKIIVRGSSLTNTTGDTEFVSTFTLTSQDGSVTVITAKKIKNSSATLIIPGTTPAGNYKLRAAKGSGYIWTSSNPLPISIIEPIVIVAQTVKASCGECSGELTIFGFGFGDKPPAGTEGYINVMQNNVPLNITAWEDWFIKATGAACDGSEITVNGLFGSATK